MTLLYTIFICVVSGLGAGLGTGFAGMSAAAVISPMLVTFLDVSAFEAIGIALASDVLASAISAYTYGKHKNIDLKNSRIFFVAVLIFTLVGTFASYFVPNATLGSFTVFATLIMGLRFLFSREKAPREPRMFHGRMKILVPTVCGMFIGFVCGFMGAGGGIMMLMILTIIMGYDLKIAVGTSVFIMTFTALLGSGSHFLLGGALPDPLIFICCVLSTLFFAMLGSRFANKASVKTLNRVTGTVLTILGLLMVGTTYL